MDDEQIRVAFMDTLGYEPRGADLVMLHVLGTDPETVADYIWDHHMGEPEVPTLDDVLATVQEQLLQT